jgi:hypothetical protein
MPAVILTLEKGTGLSPAIFRHTACKSAALGTFFGPAVMEVIAEKNKNKLSQGHWRTDEQLLETHYNIPDVMSAPTTNQILFIIDRKA